MIYINNYRQSDPSPCSKCRKWISNNDSYECTIECNDWEWYVNNHKSCWNCEYYLIGAGCYKDKEIIDVDFSYVCDSWIEEKEVLDGRR